jgi:hypothetical protein
MNICVHCDTKSGGRCFHKDHPNVGDACPHDDADPCVDYEDSGMSWDEYYEEWEAQHG